MEVIRTEQEIEDLVGDVDESTASGRSKFPSNSYEDGVNATLQWLTEESTVHPMRD